MLKVCIPVLSGILCSSSQCATAKLKAEGAGFAMLASLCMKAGCRLCCITLHCMHADASYNCRDACTGDAGCLA